jgi:hypothetical protein
MDEKREKSPKEYAQFIEWLNRDASTADIAKLLKLAGI